MNCFFFFFLMEIDFRNLEIVWNAVEKQFDCDVDRPISTQRHFIVTAVLLMLRKHIRLYISALTNLTSDHVFKLLYIMF